MDRATSLSSVAASASASFRARCRNLWIRDALYGSLRVADLLAAEKDIRWHRGIGR